GAHQPAGTEEHATEPPGHHGDGVAHLVTAEHLQHRGPRRACRLPVVGRTLDGRVRAEDERRTVVASVPVLLAQAFDDGPRLTLILHAHEGGEEAAALHLDLRLAVASDGEVARHVRRWDDPAE